jgi:hypothetical protein
MLFRHCPDGLRVSSRDGGKWSGSLQRSMSDFFSKRTWKHYGKHYGALILFFKGMRDLTYTFFYYELDFRYSVSPCFWQDSGTKPASTFTHLNRKISREPERQRSASKGRRKNVQLHIRQPPLQPQVTPQQFQLLYPLLRASTHQFTFPTPSPQRTLLHARRVPPQCSKCTDDECYGILQRRMWEQWRWISRL